MARGLVHMSAISAAGGRHAVVDGSKRLSTGLAALYSVMTPEWSIAAGLRLPRRRLNRTSSSVHLLIVWLLSKRRHLGGGKIPCLEVCVCLPKACGNHLPNLTLKDFGVSKNGGFTHGFSDF